MAMTALAYTSDLIETSNPADAEFAADVVKGLTARRKNLPPKYFYDQRGSELFEQITELPEYYPTRCELAILKENASAIAALIPEGAALIEFGSGASRKTRILLEAAKLGAYVPVDISAAFLEHQAQELRREFPKLRVLPVAADFGAPFKLPAAIDGLPRVGFFPGSTIGNLEPHEAAAFLRQAGQTLGAGAVLIIGVDLIKHHEILHAAYNDAQGVTAAFNLNMLARINRELGGQFDLAAFEHHAFYNRERHRIEMHLASLKRQKVRVGNLTVDFRAGETIHTESSYKYTVPSFTALARGAGWSSLSVWSDPGTYFSVHALVFGEAGPRSTTK
jgi:dimethylhistidine N-methyltransferase